jgi:GNAT superfamily N-acetyltransferase
MNIRPLTRGDATALLEVWNRAATYDPMTARLLQEKIWDDPDFSESLAWAIESAGQLVAWIVGVFRPVVPTPLGFVKLLAVEPAQHGQQTGSLLLKQVEELLVQQGAKEIRIAESAPNYLTPGVDQRYTQGLSFFKWHGYEPFAEAQNLSVDLTVEDYDTRLAEEKLLARGIVVRRATADDRPTLVNFLEAHWPAWRDEVGCTYAGNPISLHLAWEDDKVISFSAYHGNNVGTGWFGPMGTDPAYRGRGVGAVLLRHCLRDLKQSGLAGATIPWAAHIGFYEQHAGARRDRTFQRFRKRVASKAEG